MNISFVITSYNIAGYIRTCLESVAASSRPGDQVILVDDGSTDETLEKADAFVSGEGFGEGVEYIPVYLGSNTIGGAGIPSNIGMSFATRDVVFFVDGDDWLDESGFEAARAYAEQSDADIVIANYLEFDDEAGVEKRPADAQRWNSLDKSADNHKRLKQALAFIAVPWRKFYRREFLERNNLRFPEGDFFFEDNPFHWSVCLAADSIDFVDATICFHRVNRPGQTMGSVGRQLLAFFTHFDSIRSLIPTRDNGLQASAAIWLLNNMAWHIERLAPEFVLEYVVSAGKALREIDDDIWQEFVRPKMETMPVWFLADLMRGGEVNAVASYLERNSIREMLSNLQEQIDHMGAQVEQIQRAVTGQAAARQFSLFSKRNASFVPHGGKLE